MSVPRAGSGPVRRAAVPPRRPTPGPTTPADQHCHPPCPTRRRTSLRRRQPNVPAVRCCANPANQRRGKRSDRPDRTPEAREQRIHVGREYGRSRRPPLSPRRLVGSARNVPCQPEVGEPVQSLADHAAVVYCFVTPAPVCRRDMVDRRPVDLALPAALHRGAQARLDVNQRAPGPHVGEAEGPASERAPHRRERGGRDRDVAAVDGARVGPPRRIRAMGRRR